MIQSGVLKIAVDILLFDNRHQEIRNVVYDYLHVWKVF